MNRKFRGIWIPRELWLCPDLTLQEKAFLAEIDSLEGEEGCYATNAYFAKFFDLSASRARAILGEMKKKGLITISFEYIEGTKQIKNRYIKVNKNYFGGKEYKDPVDEFSKKEEKNPHDPCKNISRPLTGSKQGDDWNQTSPPVQNQTSPPVQNQAGVKTPEPIHSKASKQENNVDSIGSYSKDIEYSKRYSNLATQNLFGELKETKPSRNKNKINSWIYSKTKILDSYKFSPNVHNEILKYYRFLVQSEVWLPDITIQGQFDELKTLDENKQLEVVRSTIARGWKSLDFQIQYFKNGGKKPTFDTSSEVDHYLKDPNNDTRLEELQKSDGDEVF